MKTKNFLLCAALLLSLLIPSLASASGDRGVIVSSTSNTVELRDLFTSEGKYLGYYYVGTEVRLLESDPDGEWVIVEIGSERGYLPSDNVYFGSDAVAPKWKQALVNIGREETLSVLYEAANGAAPAGAVQRGVAVTVMGETDDHRCYVKTGALYGYVPADKLLVGATALPDEPDAPQATSAPAETARPQQTSAPAASIQPAQGDYGTAFVTAQTSRRVNLRAKASASSRSLGLYYVGTQVQCLSDPNREWVCVSVGGRSGYMKSEYLDRGTTLRVSRQPMAVVSNGSKDVALRQSPSSGGAIEATLRRGDAVTVLGETDTGWSYVCAGDTYGYVLSKYLTLDETASPAATTPPPAATARPTATVRPDTTAQPANYTTAYYMPSPYVAIEYPVFPDERLNAMVLDKLRRISETLAEDAAMQYACAVTLSSDTMLSIVFWGGGETANGMHESTDLQTLNIDVTAYRELTLQDLYDVNVDFEKVFLARAFYPTAPQTSYDPESFAEMLLLQTPAYKSVSSFANGAVQCFLKPDGIVLSMPSVHATGCDHFEGQLLYGDIEAFRLPQGAPLP